MRTGVRWWRIARQTTMSGVMQETTVSQRTNQTARCKWLEEKRGSISSSLRQASSDLLTAALVLPSAS